jgi:hypothetical protein
MQAVENHKTHIVNQQHSALELQIPCPTRSRGQHLPTRLDRALFVKFPILVASVGTGKVRSLVEIRFDSVVCYKTMPAQGSCHRSFEGLDLGFYQYSFCVMVISVLRVLVLFGL